eukprot:gene40288-53255_t
MSTVVSQAPAGASEAGIAPHAESNAVIKPGYHPRLTNEDLAPLKKQTWGQYNIFAFWMSDVHSVGGYITAGSLFALGLSSWQVLVSLLVVANTINIAADIAAMGEALQLVVGGVLLLRRVLFSPFGYALRAGRDSVLRADAIGIDVKRMQWAAFVIAGTVAGLAGALYAFSKGSISPESLSVGKSVDGLVMVLLGGIQTLAGPVVGAVTFTWLHDTVARNTDYWRAMLGAIILILVLLFPQGIAGSIKQLAERWRAPRHDAD